MSIIKKASSAKPASAKVPSGRHMSGGAGSKATLVAGKPSPITPRKSGTRSASSPPGAASKAKASANILAGSALNVSIKVNPLVDIVRHHVRNLSPAAVRAIRQDFAKALEFSLPPRLDRSGQRNVAAKTGAADTVLSSQEAANLAGVSRPYMVARIDAGDVKLHQMVGNQRRVLKSSVLAWQKREQARRRRALAQLGSALDDEIFSD
jgi:excisionase family DNA binding protein